MEKLRYYKSEKGIYLAKGTTYPNLDATNWTVNGVPLVATHKSGWWFVEGVFEINSLEKLSPKKAINFRWELNGGVSEEVKALTPQVVSGEEACEVRDDDYNWEMGSNSPHYGFAGFYRRVNDYSTPVFESVDFTVEYLGEVESVLVEAPDTPKFQFYRSRYKSDGMRTVDLSEVTTNDQLNEMLVPPLLLHNTPCEVSSANTYKIVRHHIKNHIDPKISAITSDYDFCFTVRKKVAVVPYKHTWEEKKRNGKPYARPRIRSKTIEYKEETIFEMSPGPKPYGNYTAISGFRGSSLADLAENIKLYLDELMYHINMPAKRCECCNGVGHIFETFNSNKR